MRAKDDKPKETGQLHISLKIVEMISTRGWNATLSEMFDRAGGTVNAAHCDLPSGTTFKIPFSVNFWHIPEASVGLREPSTERTRVHRGPRDTSRDP